MKKKKLHEHEKDITILRKGTVTKLKAPYTPAQARKFRDGK